MSVIFCYKQQPQPWMYYITPDKITFSGDCCPALVTDLTHLLPFQVISQGAFQKLEYRLYGETAWTELTITYSEVMIEGFYFISYNGTSVTALPCGVYEFRLTAGETWYFEPIMIEDFTITENALSVRDELMTPFKFTEQIIDTTPLIAPCDRILPFMFRTDNATSGSIVVTMVDSDGAETALSITVSTGVIDGKTYYWHRGECLYPFLTCGKYYLKIVDGANTYYSVPFVPECGISDIPDGYQPMRDMNGCVMRVTDGAILYEECSDIPDPEPPIEEIKYGYLYNWYVANDVRNIAADGWNIPTDDDINTLAEYLGGIYSSDDGGYPDVGSYLKDAGCSVIDLTMWQCGVPGTNSSGFTARGGGKRSAIFENLREFGYFWQVEGAEGFALMSYVESGTQILYKSFIEAYTGLSIRILKDATTLTHGQTGTYTGNDGKTYRTICIGTQEWLADNLCETEYRNGDPIPEVTDNTAWAALTTGARCSYDNDESNAFTI